MGSVCSSCGRSALVRPLMVVIQGKRTSRPVCDACHRKLKIFKAEERGELIHGK